MEEIKMKLKKIIAGVSAAALAASMSCAFSASAVTLDADKVDFEDGDFSFVYMNVDDASADPSVLSVEDYDGSKQLKVDVTKASNAPKVWFDLDKIMPREKTVTIKQIEFDLTIVPKNAEEQVGWAGGAVGAAGGFDTSLPGSGQKNPSWSQGDWSCEDEAAYTPGAAAKTHVVRKFLLPTQMYSDKGVNPFFGLMRWAAETDYVMYIDNIVFTNEGGKAITVGIPPVEETTVEDTAAAEETTAAAAEETTAAPVEETTAAAVEETTAAPVEAVDTPVEATEAAPAETEAPAETTAAPAETTAASNTGSGVPATGNVPVAAIVGVMAVAGAAAVISKKRG